MTITLGQPDGPRSLPGPGVPVDQTPLDEKPSGWGAAFRQENDMVNLAASMAAPSFDFDSNFDYVARAKQSFLFSNYSDLFVGVGSEAEWEYTERKLAEELKDRAALQQAGIAGIAMQMAAGVLSPTILLPAGGAAASANVLRAAGKTALWTMIGAGVQEAVLHQNQLTRTGTETAIGVSTAGVFGGILGGAIRYIDPLGMDAAARHMADDMESGTIQSTAAAGASKESQPQSLSAAAVNDPLNVGSSTARLADAGKLASAFGLEKLTKGLSPLMRMSQSNLPAVRWISNQLSTGGAKRTENSAGVPTAHGGDIESRAKGWQGKAIQAEYAQLEQFKLWWKTAKHDSKFRGFFGKRAAKQDFFREVTSAVNLRLAGLEHEVPEMRKAAQTYLDDVFTPLLEEAKRLEMPGFKDVPIEAAMRRVMQKVSDAEVNGKWHEFRTVLRENALEVLRRDVNSLDFREMMEGVDIEVKKGTDPRNYDLEAYADAISEKVYNRLTGSFTRHGTLDSMLEVPERAWRFYYIDPEQVWSNGVKFGDFLEKDMENITRSFTRTMSGDVELMRTFDTVNPANRESRQGLKFWSRWEEEHKAAMAEAPDAKAREKLTKEFHQAEKDLDTLVGRLRHTWGQPTDPYNVMFRAGRAILNVNTTRLMGSVVLASVADLARPVLKYGLLNTMRHGVIPMMRDMKKFRMTAREAQYAGAALDLRAHGRSTAMFDLFETEGYGTKFERGLQWATQKTGIVAGFDLWNQELKMFSGHVMMGKMMHDIDRVNAGKATKSQKAFLASINLDEGAIARIGKLVREEDMGTEVSKGVFFPNTESWSTKTAGDRELLRTFRAALVRGVDDTIVTPGIERPAWVDASTWGRIIGQFRSFTFSSTYKVGVAAAQDAKLGNYAQIANGSFLSLALGAFSYYTWAASFGPNSAPYKRMQRELDDALDGDMQALGRWADEAIGRSGLTGVLQEVARLGERIPMTRNAVTFANENTARSPFVNPLLETLGPSVGLLNNAGQVLMTMDDPSSTTFNKLKTVMPYQNVFYLRAFFDKMNDIQMESVFGVKPN